MESAFDNKSAANKAHPVKLGNERKARVRIQAELARDERVLPKALVDHLAHLLKTDGGCKTSLKMYRPERNN